jgi:hypothetical protein
VESITVLSGDVGRIEVEAERENGEGREETLTV